MKKHANIPIFIPHLGCPNQCVFCNQRYISSVTEFDISTVIPTIEEALSTIDTTALDTEIAFFGGSFTGIARSLMVRLLDIAESYVSRGLVSGIRLSTRPDYINQEVLDILGRYHVKSVELGIQSASDIVLAVSKRGHLASDSQSACRMVKAAGFDLVGQMMIGLPGASIEDELATAKMIIDSGASSARVYPAIVFKNTELDEMYRQGIYSPLSIDDAVERAKKVCLLFIKNNVNILRIGLCASENLSSSETYSAGPNHEAIGELVSSAIYYDMVCEQIEALEIDCFADRTLCIFAPRQDLSKVSGQRKQNKISITARYKFKNVKIIPDDDLPKYNVEISVI